MNKKHFLLFFLWMFWQTQSQNIRTIQLKPLNSELQSSVVPMGTVLALSFDDLDGDTKEYQYKIEHMTYDWSKPSNLSTNQYIQGFEQNYFDNYSNSFNTLQAYTHYSVEIPNENVVIIKSGNYLISVLDEDDNVLFTRKCVFYENSVTVGVSVDRSISSKTTNQKQNVQFIINYPELAINNPSQEVKTTVFQNNNWNTARYGLTPKFFRPNQLLFNYTSKNNFTAGNEFRNFDTKNIRNSNLNVAFAERKNIYHTHIYTDEPKASKVYSYNPDVNGNFVVRTLESKNTDTEADYSIIHFSLESFNPIKNKKIYVVGLFNNYQTNTDNELLYDNNDKTYKVTIPFKQGFYNYQYVTVDANGHVNNAEIDGSFYQTENEYTVIAYYKPFGAQYYRAIGARTGFFNQNR